MNILLIRHAESLHNIQITESLDSTLSKRGCDQVHQTAKWLVNNFPLDGVLGITSPYLRALETSCAIYQRCGIQFNVNGGAREFHLNKDQKDLSDGGIYLPNRSGIHTNFGWPSDHWSSEKTFYANEGLNEFIDRIRLFLDTLAQQSSYVIVSHGAPVRVMHDILMGEDLDYLKDRYSTQQDELRCEPRSKSDSIRNCSLTWIVDGKCKWFSKTVCDVPTMVGRGGIHAQGETSN